MKKIYIIVTFILALSACSFSSKEVTPPQAETKTEAPVSGEITRETEAPFIPTAGGIIRIDCRNPKTFNPIHNEDLSVDRLLRLVYEPLIALDENLKPSPAVASSWDFSPDGQTLTLHIRQDALWEDGEDITAADVVFTLDTIKANPEAGLYRLCAENILGYAAPNDKTLKITYEKPFGGAIYNLTFPVIPKHHFSQASPNEETTLPLGSGRYKVTEFNVMRDITLTASWNCYRGRPKITEVSAVIVRDLDSSLYTFDQDMIDIVETMRTDWRKICTTRQSNVFSRASNNYEFLALNFRSGALRDINIRKAIAHSVPKAEIIDKYYNGGVYETNSPVNPQSWLYEPNVASYEYSTDKAREYLRLSAYAFEENETLKLLVNNDNPERMATAERLLSELTQAGIPCVIEAREFSDYSYRLSAGYFDIAVCGLEMPLNPDLAPYFGNIGGISGKNNFIAYKDDVLDGYLAQAQLSVFEAAQSAAYSSIQKHLAESLPYISLFYRAELTLAGKNVHGEIKPVINDAYYNIGDLYIRH